MGSENAAPEHENRAPAEVRPGRDRAHWDGGELAALMGEDGGEVNPPLARPH